MRFSNWLRKLLPAGLLLLHGAPVAAQLEPVLTNPVTNPGLQQQQELLQQQQLRAPAVQRTAPKPLLQQEIPSEAPLNGNATVLLRQVQVQGARAIPSSTIAALFTPLLSTATRPRPVSFSELQAVLDQATNLYRSRGYFISRVTLPRGAYQNGVLQVLAIEGFLEAVEVNGKGSDGLKRWTRFYLQPLLSDATNPQPLQFKKLERQLLLMQSFGGVRFNATLAQGRRFGGSTLVITLNPQSFSGGISLDNNVQPLLGEVQLSAQLQTNVLHAPQPLQVNLFGTNAFPYPGGLASGAFSLSTPLGNRGLRLVGIGSGTSTSSTGSTVTGVGGPPITLTTGGQSWLGNLALRYPLLLSRRGSLGLSLAAEMQDAISNTYFNGQLAFANPSRLRVLRLGVDGSLTTPFYASSANLQISQGLPIFGAYDAGSLAETGGSLTLGSVSYTSARVTLRHQQRLGSGNTFVTATGSGQLTSTALPNPEDFSYGGSFLGRAYRGTYLVGDQGVAAGLELSHSVYGSNWTLTPFVFGDFGLASNKGRLPTPPNYQAGSYGLGLRGNWTSNTSFELGWGLPAGAYPASLGRSGPANSIVYFRAAVSF